MSDTIKKEYDFENKILTLFDEMEWPLDDENNSSLIKEELQEDLSLLLSSKKVYTRLKECDDEKMREVLLSQLMDFDFVSNKYSEFLSYLEDVDNYMSKILQQIGEQSTFSDLNQILKSFQIYNETLETMKDFDEDVFISHAISDSKIPYSEEFAEAISRMRLNEEEKIKNQKQNDLDFEKTFEEIQEILSGEEELLIDEKSYNSLEDKEDDFQEEMLEGNTFQTCVLNQKRLFEMERTPFYLLSECVGENVQNVHILDSLEGVEVSLYSKEAQKLFELNARLYSQKFVDDYFFQPYNTFVDVQAASKECFKPMYQGVLALRRSLTQKEKTGIACAYEKTLKKNASQTWTNLVQKISSDKKLESSLGWQNFVSAVDQGNIEKIEETWQLFERMNSLSDEIKLLYSEFILALVKKIITVPVYPSKDIPYSPFKMVVLLNEIEKKERYNLRVLLKWVLKCALVDFQTFINMPLLKKAMKDMYEVIQTQIEEELKNVFFIYKKTIQRMNLLNQIEICKLKQIPQGVFADWEKNIRLQDKDGNSCLLQSIFLNDMNAFLAILKSGAFVDDVTYFGETSLILLAKLERYDWIDVLLKYKPNVNAFDFSGATCAHYLAKNNQVKLLKKIDKMGANFNRVNGDECTPLYIAAEAGNFETVRFLAEKNISIDKGNFLKKTPLHVALENGDKKTVSFLIEQGADIFVRDRNLKTSLHYAAVSGLVESVTFFIENDFNLNARDIQLRTPLHMACLYGQKEVVKKLIEAGADINLKDLQGQTPLHIATAVGSIACINLLLLHNAEVDCLDNQGQTALYLAALNKQNKPFKELVDQGGKIYLKTNETSSVAELVQEGTDRALKNCLKKYEESNTFFDIALFLGIFRENKALVEKAIAHGSHLKDLSVCEKNALEWALEVGNLEIIELLYQNNCLPVKKYQKNIGHTSMIESIVQNNVAHIRLLIKSGADVNACDAGTKHSLLHYASAIGNVKAIDILVENGADINIKDARGKTPLYIARQAHQYEAEELLLSLGAEDNAASKPISYLDGDE
ncbi:MAG: ankyrin repeat domain-containing protein [Alphaproteobacteria bacterium]|nr:ankyrin repeat domain-containing protein [Alphaproteobacteria bacterium]